jgi:hypothetical protein
METPRNVALFEMHKTGIGAVVSTQVTLRDLFAAAALVSIARTLVNASPGYCAAESYALADAMLLEREK